jgi:hypothetical protein
VSSCIANAADKRPVTRVLLKASYLAVWANPDREGFLLVRLDSLDSLDCTMLRLLRSEDDRRAHVRQYLTCTFPSHLKSPASTNPLKTRFIGDME